MIQFADSAAPSLIRYPEFTHVAVYANGMYQWPDDQVARFPAHVRIGVEAGQPAQAEVARVLDVECFDAAPADFPPFVRARHAAGHDDATVYTSILGDPGYGIEPVIEELTSNGLMAASWRLWVAWWWQRPFPPTAAEVLAEIRALTNIVIAPGRLWACQWQNGPAFDTSVLYKRDDFVRLP